MFHNIPLSRLTYKRQEVLAKFSAHSMSLSFSLDYYDDFQEFTSEASNRVIAVFAAREAKKIIEEAEAKKKSQQGVRKKAENIGMKKTDKFELKAVGNGESKRPAKRSAGEIASSTVIKTSPISGFFPPKTRENARLENESGQSLLEFKKNKPAQNFLQSVFMPTPLMDRIKEEEKYGNTGDKFIGIGRALVNGFEGISNFLNTVVDVSSCCLITRATSNQHYIAITVAC